MASGIPLASVLQLLDGTPHRKVPSAIFERLPLAKVLSGGDVGALMPQVLKDGNLSSILQNPVAPIIDRFVRSLPGGGGDALTAAMGGLRAAGDNLIGLSNGGAGLFDLLGHASLVGMMGAHLPPELGLDRVLGPVTCGPVLTTLLEGRSNAVAVGNPVEVAQGIVQASANALAQGRAIQPLVSAVASLSGALAMPGDALGPDDLQKVLSTFIHPAVREAMRGAVAAQASAEGYDLVDVAAMTALD